MFTIWEFDLYNEREMDRDKKKKERYRIIWNIDYDDKINPKKTTYCLGISFFCLFYFILHTHTYIYI